MTSSDWILLLSGSSSSGKSTLGRAILDQVDQPCALLEADSAYPALSGNTPSTGIAPIVTFHQSVMTWSSAGYCVILDGSLPYGDPDLRQRCLDALPADRRFVVAVSCEVSQLRRREADRPQARQPGWAEHQAVDVNDGLDMLMRVDTTHSSPEQHARLVLTALRQFESGIRVRTPAEGPADGTPPQRVDGLTD